LRHEDGERTPPPLAAERVRSIPSESLGRFDGG
jgi:hypothetical protein